MEESVSISLISDTVLVSDNKKKRNVPLKEHQNNDFKKVVEMFDSMAEYRINALKVNKKEDSIVLFLQYSNMKIKTTIKNFSVFKQRKYFKKVYDNIIKYNKNVVKKRLKKYNIRNIVIAGSIVTSVTTISVVSTNFNNEFIADAANNEENSFTDENTFVKENTNTIEPIEVLDDFTITTEPIVTPNNAEIVNSNENIEKPNIKDNTEKLNKEQNNDYVDFNELKNFDDYDDYIRFASKLYFVDYDTLKNLVNEYLSNPNGNILDLNIHSIDYMKELKEKGFIDGDLNVIYIINIAMKYASKHTDLNNLAPIKSTKTVEEKQQDLVNFATYVYGINNPELLLTISKLETGHYTSPLCVEKNNIGGIRSTATFDSYRTFEIGVAELSRVFLYNTSLAIHRTDYDPSMPIQYSMSKSYCTDSPYEWYTTVTSMLDEGTSQATVEKVLNQSGKSY